MLFGTVHLVGTNVLCISYFVEYGHDRTGLTAEPPRPMSRPMGQATTSASSWSLLMSCLVDTVVSGTLTFAE